MGRFVQHQALTDPDRWWESYGSYYADRQWEKYRPLLGEFVSHAPDGPLLDVGAGYGFLVECARRFGIQAVGLEASEAALTRAAELHPQIAIRQWMAGQPLPFPPESIGGAVLNEFVDHVSRDDNQKLFAELHRVLKPSGVVIVKSPSKYDTKEQELDKGHITFFSAAEFAEFVQSFSFEVVRQPFVPLPIAGNVMPPSVLLKVVQVMNRLDRWAARIDLVARKATPKLVAGGHRR
jgi:SAM-dependent methyltransferase